MKKPLLLALALATFHCMSAMASDASSLALPTVPELREQMKKAKANLASLPSGKQSQVDYAIKRIENNLGASTSYDDLDARAHTEVVNDVALVNSVMTEQEDRLICKRERRLGTNRLESICKTKSQWEAYRNAAQDTLRHDKSMR